jgi:hypothetical protein
MYSNVVNVSKCWDISTLMCFSIAFRLIGISHLSRIPAPCRMSHTWHEQNVLDSENAQFELLSPLEKSRRGAGAGTGAGAPAEQDREQNQQRPQDQEQDSGSSSSGVATSAGFVTPKRPRWRVPLRTRPHEPYDLEQQHVPRKKCKRNLWNQDQEAGTGATAEQDSSRRSGPGAGAGTGADAAVSRTGA